MHLVIRTYPVGHRPILFRPIFDSKETCSTIHLPSIIVDSYEFFPLKNYLKNYTLENCKRIFDAQYFNESPSFKIPPQHFHESNFCWWVEKLTFYF